MPIIIPRELPAYERLRSEKIFVMDEKRSVSQDIRPIEMLVLNLMPTKVETETQLLRLLGNSPLQVNVTFLQTATYKPTHVSDDHMERFYETFDKIKDRKFDGMIITGAPVEQIPFEEVQYWDELVKIMDYANSNVTSTIYICWGAQAGLYHFFGIGKKLLDKKLFGIFPCEAAQQNDMLLKGMDDTFYIPNSRHTEADQEAIENCSELKILARSKEAGIAICKTHDNKSFFFTGHSEYDRYTLRNEYIRDLNKGLPIEKPVNYFTPTCGEDLEDVDMKWKSTANLLFYNWLNYYVYQVTPYKL